MLLCKVVGKSESAVRHQRLDGKTLLVVRRLDGQGKAEGDLNLAVDLVGAGMGETVAVVSGSVAARAAGGADVPVDAAIVAIIDHVFVNGKELPVKD